MTGERLRLVPASLLALMLLTMSAGGLRSAPLADSPGVAIGIDSGDRHQSIEGFGAFTESLVFGGKDYLTPDLRARALDAVYNQVRLTMGTLPPLYQTASTSDDGQAKSVKASVIDLARPLGFTHYFLGPSVDTRADQALVDLRRTDYNRYIDQIAGQILRTQLYWRDQYGIVPLFHMLFIEPLYGGRTLDAANTRDLVDIVKRTGAALRNSGFTSVKFVVPSEESEENSLAEAQAILADPEAAAYVGAIAYHVYPYGSVYASVPRILSTSGAGVPDSGRIAVRNQLRDLAEQHGVEAWMTEVSHGEVDARSYDGFRGRAIQIHDEMVYADASAYFGMNSMWDMQAHREHFSNSQIFSEDSSIALIDDDANAVYITGMGRAIGHYARWVRSGSVRIGATSSDPLVEVTAFRNDASAQVVLVTINNSNTDRVLSVGMSGSSIASSIVGEQSTPTAYWQSIGPVDPTDASNFGIDVPPLSVTTLTWPIGTQTAVQPKLNPYSSD